MPIDTSMYGRLDYSTPVDALYAGERERQARTAAQQENQLNALRLNEAQRTTTQRNEMARLTAGLDLSTPEGRTAAAQAHLKVGDVAGYRAAATAEAAQTEAERKSQTATFELAQKRYNSFNQVAGALSQKPDVTKQDVLDAGRGLVAIGMLDKEHADAMFAQLPDDPVQLRGALQNVLRQQLTPEQVLTAFAPKPKDINAGGSTEIIDENPNSPTFGKLIKSVRHTQAPGEDARLAETRADSTVMTPEEVDYYANMYNQTNSLPPLGMGSASLRQKILSRAAQIGMAGGASAAEGAANVVSNAQTRNAEKKTLAAFTSGVESRRVTANNTAVNHLATMEALADNLANSDIRILNAAKQAYAKATGSAAPASFDAAKQLVAAEVIKAVVNNGGGVKEREEAAGQFARANSPEQLKAVIQTYKELLAGQLSSLQQQYETGTGRKDFDSKLSPRTRELLSVGAPATGGDLMAAARAELARRRGAQK